MAFGGRLHGWGGKESPLSCRLSIGHEKSPSKLEPETSAVRGLFENSHIRNLEDFSDPGISPDTEFTPPSHLNSACEPQEVLEHQYGMRARRQSGR